MNIRTEITNDDMAKLWQFLEDMYGASFKSQYVRKVREWLNNFNRNGLTPAHLEIGMQKCVDNCYEHCPNLSTFSGLCLPTAEDLGLPNEDQAYIMAVKREWVHPVIWHAVQMVGSYEFRHWPETRSRRAFKKHYQALLRRLVAGEVFVIPTQNVPVLEVKLPSQEEIDKAKAEWKSMTRRLRESA